MHQKIVLVDQLGVLAGSANYDYRSFHLNLEVQLWLEGEGIVQEVEAMLAEDFEKATELLPEALESRRRAEKLKSVCASWLRPLL